MYHSQWFVLYKLHIPMQHRINDDRIISMSYVFVFVERSFDF